MMVMSSLCPVGEGMVASGGYDGAVRVWSTKDGRLHEPIRFRVCAAALGALLVLTITHGVVATPLFGLSASSAFPCAGRIPRQAQRLSRQVHALRKPVFEFAREPQFPLLLRCRLRVLSRRSPLRTCRRSPRGVSSRRTSASRGLHERAVRAWYYTTVGAAVLSSSLLRRRSSRAAPSCAQTR